MIIKRIFAVVSEKHFYMFRKRAYDAELTFGKALELLAIAYAEGEITLNHERPPKENKNVRNFYLKKKIENKATEVSREAQLKAEELSKGGA